MSDRTRSIVLGIMVCAFYVCGVFVGLTHGKLLVLIPTYALALAIGIVLRVNAGSR